MLNVHFMVFMQIKGTVISVQIALRRYPITVSPSECGGIKYVISSNIVEDRSDDNRYRRFIFS